MSFAGRRGEILGPFGLVGSGIDELSKTLFGALRPDGGTIPLHGRGQRFHSFAEALGKGMFLVPGARRAEGLTLNGDLVFNNNLANRGSAAGPAGLLRFGASRRAAADLAARVGLQPPRLDGPARAFSGATSRRS